MITPLRGSGSSLSNTDNPPHAKPTFFVTHDGTILQKAERLRRSPGTSAKTSCRYGAWLQLAPSPC